MPLITENTLGVDADDVYTQLLDAMQGMTVEQAQRFNARLVLMLINQIGDPSIVSEAIQLARKGLDES